MPETIISKRCSKCKKTKPISEFYKNKSMKDGLQNQCRSCNKGSQKRYVQSEKGKFVQHKGHLRYYNTKKGKAMRKRYQQSKEGKVARKRYMQSEKRKTYEKQFRLNHSEYGKANATINHLIASGKLPQANTLQCHYCPTQAEQYHHWHGYEPEYWLDVIPVCKICHNKIHKGKILCVIAS